MPLWEKLAEGLMSGWDWMAAVVLLCFLLDWLLES